MGVFTRVPNFLVGSRLQCLFPKPCKLYLIFRMSQPSFLTSWLTAREFGKGFEKTTKVTLASLPIPFLQNLGLSVQGWPEPQFLSVRYCETDKRSAGLLVSWPKSCTQIFNLLPPAKNQQVPLGKKKNKTKNRSKKEARLSRVAFSPASWLNFWSSQLLCDVFLLRALCFIWVPSLFLARGVLVLPCAQQKR